MKEQEKFPFIEERNKTQKKEVSPEEEKSFKKDVEFLEHSGETEGDFPTKKDEELLAVEENIKLTPEKKVKKAAKEAIKKFHQPDLPRLK